MKYLINEDKNIGIQNVTDELRENLLVSLGFEARIEEAKKPKAFEAPEKDDDDDKKSKSKKEDDDDTKKSKSKKDDEHEEDDEDVKEEGMDIPALYAWDDAAFALHEDVFEMDDTLFVRVEELDSDLVGTLHEDYSDSFINSVSYEDEDYTLGDIFDYGDEIYVQLEMK
jgi:hypothetical protein